MFISFEGLDNSGKSTQISLLQQRLHQRGHTTLLLREPGGTTISERIRELLLDTTHLEMTPLAEILLFSAARAQLVAEVIRPALAQGTIVLSDRFYDSTTAYQGHGRGLQLSDVRALNRLATGGLDPDLTFFLDVPLDEIQVRHRRARSASDRMESSGAEFYRRVRQGYLDIASDEPGRVIVVDGSGKIEKTHEEIWNIVYGKLA